VIETRTIKRKAGRSVMEGIQPTAKGTKGSMRRRCIIPGRLKVTNLKSNKKMSLIRKRKSLLI